MAPFVGRPRVLFGTQMESTVPICVLCHGGQSAERGWARGSVKAGGVPCGTPGAGRNVNDLVLKTEMSGCTRKHQPTQHLPGLYGTVAARTPSTISD